MKKLTEEKEIRQLLSKAIIAGTQVQKRIYKKLKEPGQSINEEDLKKYLNESHKVDDLIMAIEYVHWAYRCLQANDNLTESCQSVLACLQELLTVLVEE